MMKYFFWIAFAVFLAASIPHVAYFFASFEPSSGPEGVWWWAVSYAIAISIDVTVYLLSWTAFQRYRKYRTAKAVWQHWLLIIMCTFFSWAVNWAYAKQFHSASMLSAAESAAPWLTGVFPFMASAFPLLGIVYTMMAETITDASTEEKQKKTEQLNTLNELARQTRLPVASLRRALTEGSPLTSNSLLTAVGNPERVEAREVEKQDLNRPITAQFVELESSPAQTPRDKPLVNNSEGAPDKLQMTIEALRIKPDMTDEALADFLSLKRPASARFWRLKALEILNAPARDITGHGAGTRPGWPSTGAVANGISGKR